MHLTLLEVATKIANKHKVVLVIILEVPTALVDHPHSLLNKQLNNNHKYNQNHHLEVMLQ